MIAFDATQGFRVVGFSLAVLIGIAVTLPVLVGAFLLLGELKDEFEDFCYEMPGCAFGLTAVAVICLLFLVGGFW